MRSIFLLLSIFALLTGCADKVIPATQKAQFHADQAEQFMQNEKYADAIASWEKVRDSFQSPELNVLAELKITEAYYLNEQYPEATAACELFLKNHPRHPEVETVFYRLGMSYYQQILPAEKDQTASKNAIITFRNLLKRYPETDKGDEIKRHIQTARDRMAEHELQVCRFYLRTNEPLAAQRRFEYLRKNYPEYPIADNIYFGIGKSYLKQGDRQTAEQLFFLLKENYPDSKYLADIEKLLQNGSDRNN